MTIQVHGKPKTNTRVCASSRPRETQLTPLPGRVSLAPAFGLWSPVTRRSLSALLLTWLALSAHASGANPSTVSTAQANDNRIAAGELKHGVLKLQLEMVEATWYPEKDAGKSLSVYAFAEKGKAPQIPGPLIRVPQDTEVRVQIHNALPVAMFVRGLHPHDPASPEPVLIAPGATADVHFTANSPGTYYYSARSTKMSLREIGLLSIIEDLPMGEGPFGIESQLDGGLIVDPPGTPADDRILMITTWMAGVITPPFREWVVINGKSWPYTERLSYRTGDTARWRLINTSISDHAMHLHGFYFQVTSAGDQDRDHLYSPDQVPHVVTRHLEPGETASIMWTPDRPGRWLLHCHMTAHMVPIKFPTTPTAEPDSHLSLPDGSHDSTGMLGLVLGITVSPGLEHAAASASALKPRQLRLLVREKPATPLLAGSHGLSDSGGSRQGDLRSPARPRRSARANPRRAGRDHGRQPTQGTNLCPLAWH